MLVVVCVCFVYVVGDGCGVYEAHRGDVGVFE